MQRLQQQILDDQLHAHEENQRLHQLAHPTESRGVAKRVDTPSSDVLHATKKVKVMFSHFQ
jgi:hypothetical protein